jgi:hypothetical protein
MNSKPWYQSLTIWFNFALLLIAFLTQVFTLFPVDPKYIALVTLIGNTLLRFKTTIAIE